VLVIRRLSGEIMHQQFLKDHEKLGHMNLLPRVRPKLCGFCVHFPGWPLCGRVVSSNQFGLASAWSYAKVCKSRTRLKLAVVSVQTAFLMDLRLFVFSLSSFCEGFNGTQRPSFSIPKSKACWGWEACRTRCCAALPAWRDYCCAALPGWRDWCRLPDEAFWKSLRQPVKVGRCPHRPDRRRRRQGSHWPCLRVFSYACGGCWVCRWGWR
jgi:hypothetical protein